MIKTLMKHVKEYKAASIVTPGFMLLEVFMETLIPYLIATLIDHGIAKGNISYVYKIGLVMILAACISLVAGMMGGIFGAKASAGFAKNLRMGMFENIQKFSFSNIDRYSTAGLVTRLTTDVTNVQNAYQMILRMCMRSPATLICAMTISYMTNAKIATIYLVAIIILSLVLVFIIKTASKYFRQGFPKYDELNGSVQENIAAIRVVKAYVREHHENEKFKKASGNIYKIFVKAENAIVYSNPAMMFVAYACILLISWIGARMIVGSGATTLSTGELASLLTYCMNILMSLMMLSMVFVMVTMSAASAERIVQVLEEKPELHNPENPVYQVDTGDIEFQDVFFSYHQTNEDYVLKNIQLSIAQGETIGILGGTGSAKTSLISLISRLYDVSKGCVKVGKRDVREYDIETLRNQVSVVLQKNILFSGTILDNLRWGNEQATREECMEACRLACADEFIQGFTDGYDTYIEQGGSNVSGGQKQRLCIARALLKKPKILILDDSTSAVDTATDARIRESLRSFLPDTTKIIIAQRVSSVMGADRIVVMEDGEINGIGTHEELLQNNQIYRDVYESQTGGSGDFDENGGEK